MTAAESRALDALDRAAMVVDLPELVELPSVTGTDAESEAGLGGPAAGHDGS